VGTGGTSPIPPFAGRSKAVKVIKIDGHPDLEALIKDLYSNGESDPIFLKHNSKRVAVIVSAVEYETLRRVEEVLSDRLDEEESEEILKDPKWISWDVLQESFA
jgi:hypothetical protein